nr:homocysteine S-methyltransferase family protein [Solirubrobacterales bacterium]
VHRRYVATGCDVISTNTWGLPSALLQDGPRLWASSRPVHWLDLARRGVRLAREAAAEEGRVDTCAVALALNGDLDVAEGPETVRLLARALADAPPDLVLVETVALVRPSLYAVVDALLETGWPVWLSFRRCRDGLCSVYGQHWGGPEGDAFGRAAGLLEAMGIGALLVNCIPPAHVAGVLPYLRDFTDLPLGAYPNLGALTDEGWRLEPGVGGEEYGEMALGWRREGAQIIGGCCGVGPEHIAGARARLDGVPPGRMRGGGLREVAALPSGDPSPVVPTVAPPPWSDQRHRPLYPLSFPDLACDPGVAIPGDGELLLWRHLARKGLGAHQRCLDVGSGTGLLGIQLALNGAAHVHALDVEERAVRTTLANAFRNGVAERMTAAVADLHPWMPDERYELVVAALTQEPVDPFRLLSTHRRVDYWGRALLDGLIAKLPRALAPEGVAYVLQLSILSQQRTDELLAAAGLEARVVEVGVFAFPPALGASVAQVERVEELSDGYHLAIGDHDLLVAYVLEIRRRRPLVVAPPWTPTT